MTLDCKNPEFLPFGNILPIELQEKILNKREEIIERERKEVISSLTIDELLKELDNKLGSQLDINDKKCLPFKCNNNVLCILKYNVLDIVESIELYIYDYNVSEDIELFWNSLSEHQKNIIAADCFDNINNPNMLFENEENKEFDIERKDEYCFHYFEEKFNNNCYRRLDNINLEIN